MANNDENSVAKITNFLTLRYCLIGILAAVGIVLSYASFKVTRNWEEDEALHHLRELTRNHGVAIEQELLTHLDFLHSIAALYDTSPFVSREEFRTFANSLLKRARGVQALEWIPLISAGERGEYERLARSDGLPDFRIKEKNATGKMVSAGTRAEYFPVYYVEPLKGNEQALGFDLGSNATRRDALAKARETGNVVVSGRIKLVQETGDQFAFLAFKPIYHKNYPIHSAELRRKFLLGFALGVFRIGDVVESALAKQTGPAGLDIYVFDNRPTAGKRFLYFHPSRARQTKVAPESEETIFDGPHLASSFSVVDREWTLVFKPVAGYFTENSTWVPWSTLIVGLVFTSILTAYLVSAAGRERRITNLVRERTGALKDSETRIRAVVDNVVDGIITISETGEIETFNPAAEQIFGYTASQIIGQNVRILMPGPYRGEHDGYLRAYLKTGEAKIIGIGREVVGKRKDGSTFPMDLAVSEMQIGSSSIFTGVVRDITERKQADLIKNEFISTVSHELRTPLTSIKGSLGLIKSGVIGKLPDKLRSLLEIAYSNSDRLERLINDILDIEKIEAGKMDFHLRPVEIVELVEKAIEANKGYGDKHGATFVLKDTPPEKAMVEGDEDRLMQALSNLMSNAAKFSPQGERVEVSVSSGAVGVRVSVTDHGPGIAPEFRSKIFEKFSQADSSDTRQEGGTGLGLSITKTIIEHHDGFLGFETEMGKGATFYFVLPALAELGAELVNADGMVGQYRALIVEDETDIAMILDMTLRQDGFKTDIAHNASEAKDMLAKDNYDVMTLDLGLPDQDGISLIQDLRSQTKTKNLPIVVVSATASEGAKKLNGDAIGVIDWLQKPIDLERLRERIRFATQSVPSRRLRILHVEDDTDVIKVVSNIVDETTHITAARTLRAAKRLLGRETFDLVILDLMLPDGAGENLLPLLHRQGQPSTPVIVFSAKEASREIAHNIKAVLLKSQTTNEALLEAIRSAIHPGKGEAQENVLSH